MSHLLNTSELTRRLRVASLAACIVLAPGCNDGDDDQAVLVLEPEDGSVFDANAYSAVAAANSLAGLWLLIGNYDYIIDDKAVRGAGRELVRASVRIEDSSSLTFTSCYTGTPVQTPQRQADGSFQVALSGGIASLTPNADNNRLIGSFVGNSGSIDFQGSLTLVKLSVDSSAKLGTARVTSAALEEESVLDTDCFFESEQELADRTGTNNPNEIVIRLSSNNLKLSDLYVEGSNGDQQLRIEARQGVDADVTLEFITSAQVIGVNKASTADITINSSDATGLQASLGAAEGDKQASVAVDIALP